MGNLTRLPPLNPLRAFEAAARHCSFTRAAAELHVTQGAISQAVKTLETHLGRTLFDRTLSGLQLTPESAAYAKTVGDSFRSITNATSSFVASRPARIVTVRAYTSFLARWLIPRIPEFSRSHPDIEMRFIAANDRVRTDHEHVDLRIRYGHGRWNGMHATLLLRDELTPVISPHLLPPDAAPYRPERLAEFTWLISSQRRNDWHDWLETAGSPGLTPARELVVEELSLVYQLAVSGAGVALANQSYVAEELASRKLFRPTNATHTRDAGYFLIWPHDAQLSDSADTFRKWVGQGSALDPLKAEP